MNKFLTVIVMTLCRILYKQYKQEYVYIKGTGNNYPRYLLYTENEKIYYRMDDF